MAFRKIILIGATLSLICTLLLGVLFPYLLRLLDEGFPSAHWPAKGSFSAITPSYSPRPFTNKALPLSSDLQNLFQTSEGAALLVAYKGELAMEIYAKDMQPDTKFNSYSLVKSLVGALILKALAEQKIASLKTPIGAFLPNLGDEPFQSISIEDLLHMRSGIMIEPHGMKKASGLQDKDMEAVAVNPFGPLARLHMGGLDAIKAYMRRAPDRRGNFNYQNVNTALLGAVLETVYDKSLPDLLSEKIWHPAGASTGFWRRYSATAPVTAYCCLYATARDWIAIALFLNSNGTADQPFLPPPLWQKFIGSHIAKQALRKGDYSFQVRHDILDRTGESLQGPFTYFSGTGGQVIYLLPEKDLVVVRFDNGSQLLHSTLYGIWHSLTAPELLKIPNTLADEENSGK